MTYNARRVVRGVCILVVVAVLVATVFLMISAAVSIGGAINNNIEEKERYAEPGEGAITTERRGEVYSLDGSEV